MTELYRLHPSSADGSVTPEDKEASLRLALTAAQRMRKLAIMGAVLAMMEDVPLGSLNLLFILGQFRRVIRGALTRDE